jgi:hypothetical protein
LPGVSPGINIGELAPDEDTGETAPAIAEVQVAVYPVMGEPPSESGATKIIVALFVPAETLGLCGTPGIVRGVTEAEADATPTPATFFAATLHEYSVPLASPDTLTMDAVGDAFLILVVTPSEQLIT